MKVIPGFMIQYVDAAGKDQICYEATDQAKATELLARADRQNEVIGQNANAAQKYINDVAAYNAAPEKMPKPVKPSMIVCPDEGPETTAPFVPALPDPREYRPVGSNPIETQAGKPSQAEVAIMTGLGSLSVALAAMQKDLAALKAKLGVS